MLKELVKIGEIYFDDDLAFIYEPTEAKHFIEVELEWGKNGLKYKKKKVISTERLPQEIDEKRLKIGITDFDTQTKQFLLLSSYFIERYIQDVALKKIIIKNKEKTWESAKENRYLEKGFNKIKLNQLSKLQKLFVESFYKILTDDSFIKILVEKYYDIYEKNKKIILFFSFLNNFPKEIKNELQIKSNKDKILITDIEFLNNIYKDIYIKVSAEVCNFDNEIECNFCANKTKILYSPTGGFYYPFTINKKNTLYNLNKEYISKHILLCKDCYVNVIKGIKFLENKQRRLNISGLNYFLTFSIPDHESCLLKDILEVFEEHRQTTISNKKKLEQIHQVFEDELQYDILAEISTIDQKEIHLNFYFWESGTRGGKEIIELVKDVSPSRIYNLLVVSRRVGNFLKIGDIFGKYKFDIFRFINEIFNEDWKNRDKDKKYKKYKAHLIRDLLIGHNIQYDFITDIVVEKYLHLLRQEKLYYSPINFLAFVQTIFTLDVKLQSNFIYLTNSKKIMCEKNFKSITELFKGDSSLKKLQNFISLNPYLKNNLDVQAGLYLGVLVARLSWNINGYEKQVLGYANKRIKFGDMNSLKEYILPIQEKIIMWQDKIGGRDINKEFSILLSQLYSFGKFSKNDFIMGMLIGYNIASQIKVSENKQDSSVEENNSNNFNN